MRRVSDRMSEPLSSSSARFKDNSTQIMDALKAEIANKRKAIQDEPTTSRPTKYMRRGDIEKMKEEEEQKAKQEKERKAREEKEAKDAAAAQKKATVSILSLLD